MLSTYFVLNKLALEDRFPWRRADQDAGHGKSNATQDGREETGRLQSMHSAVTNGVIKFN